MSTHVIAFRPPDATWQTMKAVWDACVAAGVEVPASVLEFFDDEEPDDAGVEIEIDRGDDPAAKKYVDGNRMQEGYEIDIRKLPPDVHIVRVYNSW